MLQGPNYIYKCPNCGNILTRGSLMSGNTYGSKTFSDGRTIAPMLPEFPELTKCKECHTFLWVSELKEIAKYQWGDLENTKWKNAETVRFLEIEEYFKAIEIGFAKNNVDELFIRFRIWWAYNDRVREGENIFNDEADEIRWEENIRKMINIFDKSDINHIIMIAEINRNLGDFKKCIEVIESIDDEELNWIKEKFINECKLKNRWVVALN